MVANKAMQNLLKLCMPQLGKTNIFAVSNKDRKKMKIIVTRKNRNKLHVNIIEYLH